MEIMALLRMCVCVVHLQFQTRDLKAARYESYTSGSGCACRRAVVTFTTLCIKCERLVFLHVRVL